MKIAIVGPVPPPNGGMAMQTLQLQKLLESRGHSVTLIAVNPPYRPAVVGKIPVLRALFRLIPFIVQLLIQLPKQDVVHTMSNSGWAWYLFTAPTVHIARLYGTPCLINYRGGLAEEFLRRSSRKIGFTLSRASRLVVPSGFLEDVFSRFGHQPTVIPNIVNLECFRYAPPDIGTARPHIVVTRNLEALYGNIYALQALKRLRAHKPDIQMTIAGSGPERSNLEQAAKALGIAESVHFVGRLDREQMAALYQQATIMLNPTTADNMPNSLLEALACGVPVVTTAVGGIPYMVDHEQTALLVPPRSPQAIAEAITRLLEEPGLAMRLSENGRALVANYSPSQLLPLWEQTYTDLRSAS